MLLNDLQRVTITSTIERPEIVENEDNKLCFNLFKHSAYLRATMHRSTIVILKKKQRFNVYVFWTFKAFSRNKMKPHLWHLIYGLRSYNISIPCLVCWLAESQHLLYKQWLLFLNLILFMFEGAKQSTFVRWQFKKKKVLPFLAIFW